MKKVFTVLGVIALFAILICGLCAATDVIMASAESSYTVSDNYLLFDDPSIWDYNVTLSSGSQSAVLIDSTASSRYFGLKLVSNGSGTASLVNNELSYSVSSTSNNFAALLFYYPLSVSDPLISSSVSFTFEISGLTTYCNSILQTATAFDGGLTSFNSFTVYRSNGLCSFTVDLTSLSSNVKFLVFRLGVYGSLTLEGFKVYKGLPSEFNGFVYRDYHFGYDDGYDYGVIDNWVIENNIDTYLNGWCREGEFYNFNSSSFDNVYLLNGNSMSSPSITYNGDGYFGRVVPSDGGLELQNYNQESVLLVRGYENVTGDYYDIIALQVNLHRQSITVTWKGVTWNITGSFTGLDQLLLFKVPHVSDNTDPFTLRLHGQNVHINFFYYKFENSRYFTRFPLGVLASNDYQAGFNAGIASASSTLDETVRREAYDNGYAVGSSTGYDDGFTQGQIQGYSQGLTDAGDGSVGTWFSAFSAMIDVPVKAITGFLDVEILGFNFLSLFRTLILITLFFFVLKSLVGKYA